MKITRLKSGYYIRLTDSEFEVLEQLVTLGQADTLDSNMDQHLSAGGKKALRHGRFSLIASMNVDEDRR